MAPASVLVICLQLLTGCTERDTIARSRDVGYNRATTPPSCETELASLPSVPLRPYPGVFEVSTRFGLQENHPIGIVAGAAWDSYRQRLYVLDGGQHHVKVYHTNGELVRIIGRQGQGPGEFEEVLSPSHGVIPRVNQIALLGSQHLAVNDLGLLHVLDTAGTFKVRVETGGHAAGLYADRHLGGWSRERVLYGRSGAASFASTDRDVRTGIELIALAATAGGLDTARFLRINNPWRRTPIVGRMARRNPYEFWHRRTWDAIATGIMATYAYDGHAICFTDQHGQSHGFRVEAPVLEVDATERRRVISRHSGTGPPTGGSWEEHYFWPRNLPFYTDILLTHDSVAWVERPVSWDRRVIDLFHFDIGYLGTMEPLSERLPLTSEPNCVFAVQEDTIATRTPFYGLARWCRRQGVLRIPGAQNLTVGHYDSADASSVLKHLLVRQTAFEHTRHRFGSDLQELEFDQPATIQIMIVHADSTGVAMIALQTKDRRECAVYYGTANPPRPYTLRPGQIRCTPQ